MGYGGRDGREVTFYALAQSTGGVRGTGGGTGGEVNFYSLAQPTGGVRTGGGAGGEVKFYSLAQPTGGVRGTGGGAGGEGTFDSLAHRRHARYGGRGRRWGSLLPLQINPQEFLSSTQRPSEQAVARAIGSITGSLQRGAATKFSISYIIAEVDVV